MNENLVLDVHEKPKSYIAWLFMSLAAIVGIILYLILNPNKDSN